MAQTDHWSLWVLRGWNEQHCDNPSVQLLLRVWQSKNTITKINSQTRNFYEECRECKNVGLPLSFVVYKCLERWKIRLGDVYNAMLNNTVHWSSWSNRILDTRIGQCSECRAIKLCGQVSLRTMPVGKGSDFFGEKTRKSCSLCWTRLKSTRSQSIHKIFPSIPFNFSSLIFFSWIKSKDHSKICEVEIIKKSWAIEKYKCL